MNTATLRLVNAMSGRMSFPSTRIGKVLAKAIAQTVECRTQRDFRLCVGPSDGRHVAGSAGRCDVREVRIQSAW